VPFRNAALGLLVPLLLCSMAAGAAAASGASLALAPSAGPPKTVVKASGQRFGAGETVALAFDGKKVATATADGGGSFAAKLTVPKGAPPGAHVVAATGQTSGRAAHASFTVRTDWPQFRFDDRHTGVQPFENVLEPGNVPRLGLAWQAQLGALVDYSSPAVVGGVAYLGSSDGRLWAYPAAGCGQTLCTTPLWTSTGLGQIIDSPTVTGGRVYVGSQTSDSSNAGKLDVFDANGCGLPVCAPLWQGDAGTQSILQSSPTVSRDRVYVGAFDGRLYVFDAAGCGAALCEPLWTGATGGTIESTPTVDHGTVFVGSDDGFLYAFPAGGCGRSSCAPLWKGRTGEAIFSSTPAVANGKVYVGSVHHLSAFAAGGCGMSACPPLWQGSHQDDFVNGSPAIFHGRVYVPLEFTIGVFDAAGCGQPSCGPVWLAFGTGTQADILSSPTIANGVLYAGKNNGQVLAWKARGCGRFVCDELWSFLTDDPIVSSSPTVADGTLYIGGSSNLAPEDSAGRLYVFDLR
jgi:outer membrane protein assembly factor BamB